MGNKINPAWLLVLIGLGLAGCDEKPNGTFLPAGSTVYDKLEFKSGNIVDVTFGGMVARGSFETQGKRVTITLDKSAVFAIDDKGCLDGGQLIGKYCKK